MRTHAGQQQTIKMARDRYLWPGLGRDIKKFVKSCTVCQKVKINRHEHVKPGQFPVEKTRFRTVHTDLVGPLPETEEGYKYILTAIDRATCYPIAVPLKSMTSRDVTDVKTTKNLFLSYIFRLFICRISRDVGLQNPISGGRISIRNIIWWEFC